jgi:hypothetical protein
MHLSIGSCLNDPTTAAKSAQAALADHTQMTLRGLYPSALDLHP